MIFNKDGIPQFEGGEEYIYENVRVKLGKNDVNGLNRLLAEFIEKNGFKVTGERGGPMSDDPKIIFEGKFLLVKWDPSRHAFVVEERAADIYYNDVKRFNYGFFTSVGG